MLKSSHLKHVMFMMEAHDHHACSKEEKGFEKSMNHEMENGRRPRTNTEGEKHVPNLADR